jgi:serine protease Do
MRVGKIVAFSAALATAVAAAVISVGAQTQGSERRPDRRAIAGSRLLMLDGRGSQLGVMVRDLEGDTAAKAGGVQIDEVSPDSPAAKAGLRAGDIVTEYDGERVRSARQFTRLVQETPEGRSVKMAILRNGQKHTVDATPEARDLAWTMGIDGDRIVREAERGMREGLRGFRMDAPSFNFRFDDGFPGMRITPRARLGVSVEGMSSQLADYFGAKQGGALVSSVTTDSPAAKAGIKAGDVITTVNGNRVQDAGDLVRELADAKSDEVTIGLLRDRKETTVKATLESRTERPRRQVQPAAFSRPA